MWDTSDAMSSDMRTLLTSGLNGACGEPAWRLSKAFLVGSFVPATEQWSANGFEIDDEGVSQIIGAASVSQTLMWKNITSVKEALREGVDEDTVLWVWSSLQETMGIFRKSARPLLGACERRIHFINQGNRFGWFEVTLQYCVGIMVLVDALEVAKRSDLLQQLFEVRKEVEHESIAVLKFGTDNVYRMRLQGHAIESGGASTRPIETMGMSFVALYAFPHLIVTLAQLMCKGVVHKRHAEELDRQSFAHLTSILTGCLEHLAQSSRAVQSARRALEVLVGGATA
jgi:hypothetical protein